MAADRDWLGARPRGDAVAEQLVLQRLEARIMKDRPAPVMLARYVVLAPIGRGGLGSVYEAYDPQLDRKIAIKVLHDRSADLRLLREAQALARLAHPNVVAVHDVGVAEDGAVFIAMDLVAGVTLSAWSAERERTWSEVRDVFEQAGRGLLAAHMAGLVHRDFKPGNVLIGDGIVRVLDFGLARAVEDPDAGHVAPSGLLGETVTAAGTWLGTPAYVAPEQIAGESVGPQADQFSFCVALHEALYGARPFVGEDVEATLAAVQRCEPAPPPPGSKVPAWLRAVVQRGLSRSPADRYPSMAELIDALGHDRRSRKRQRIAGGLALVVAAGLGGALVLALQPEPTPAEVGLVEQLTDEARAAAAQSWFVYPPADDPEHATAYRKVLELEAQTGAVESLADRRGEELRDEFAATLVRLGDEYWAREGGAAFASDYYAAALAFDPDHGHARARTTLTPGEVRTLADKAAEGEFSPAELVAGESLAVLAEADPQRRVERARRLIAREEGAAPSTGAKLRELVGDEEVAPSVVGSANTVVGSAAAAIDPARADDLDQPAAVDAGAGEVATSDPAKPSRSRENADALVAEAAQQSRAGNTSAATALLHRALRADRNHHAALAELAHLSFEAGKYHDAIRFAARAVAVAPKRAKSWQLLGDAHFRVLAYDDARAAYRRAADLGLASARKRLALVDARTGSGANK